MEKKASKPKVKDLRDYATPEELEAIKNYQSGSSDGVPVDSEWMILAEWLQIAGYQAYLDAKNDAKDENGNLIVTINEMITLITATRKLRALDMDDNIQVGLAVNQINNSKHPKGVYRSVMKRIHNQLNTSIT